MPGVVDETFAEIDGTHLAVAPDLFRRTLGDHGSTVEHQDAIGVLFTEHDMDVVFEHADRILVLNRGTVIAEGSPEQVRRNGEVRAIYLGEGLVYDARHRGGAPS